MELLPYFLSIVTLLFFVWQIYPYFKLRSTRGKAAPALDKILDSEQRKQHKILLYFMAPHCGMCRHVTPIIDDLSNQRSDVKRIDISIDADVAKELGVRGTPAFVLIENGVIEKVKLGALPKDKILKMLG